MIWLITKCFRHIQHLAPDPWNSWKSEWLSELKSGDSKRFTINYTINNPISPGEYDTTFEFGLAYQVTKTNFFKEIVEFGLATFL